MRVLLYVRVYTTAFRTSTSADSFLASVSTDWWADHIVVRSEGLLTARLISKYRTYIGTQALNS